MTTDPTPADRGMPATADVEWSAESAEPPAIWYSPSLAASSNYTNASAGLIWRYVSGQGYVTPPNLPADAVRLVSAAELDRMRAERAAALKLADELECEADELRDQLGYSRSVNRDAGQIDAKNEAACRIRVELGATSA